MFILHVIGSKDLAGLGIQYGALGPVAAFPHGRHTRRNYNNITKLADGTFVYGEVLTLTARCLSRPFLVDALPLSSFGCVWNRLFLIFFFFPSPFSDARQAVEGEGIFVCHNQGSCVAPDECSCTDGWAGFDCALPLCRHLRPYDPYGSTTSVPTTRTVHISDLVCQVMALR